jgi:Sugar-transfer associated ATP-grasp
LAREPLAVDSRRSSIKSRLTVSMALDSLRAELPLPILSRVGHVLGVCRRTARRHRVPLHVILRRLARLWFGQGIRPLEALKHGLADPAMNETALQACLGKERFRQLQENINPPGLECLLKDKSIFYPYCQAVGLAIPRLYAVFDVLGGWSGDGALLATDAEWEAFFHDSVPAEFVVKPAWGIYGEGFQIFTRDGDGFRDTRGQRFSPAELIRSLRDHRSYRRWLIQDRLRNHPDLDLLTGTSYLQSVRITTFVASDGIARAFSPLFKVIAGSSVTDNIEGGRTGNFLVAVRPSDGLLYEGRTFDADSTGMSAVTHHPRTGHALAGVRLPLWDQAIELVKRAAKLFLPIRAIGWDVGLTPAGPKIVEGNIWWDPPYMLATSPPEDKREEGAIGQLMESIRAEARRPSRPGRGYRSDRL